MPNKISGRVALCGVLGALILAVMLLGTMLPLATYACPALAGAMSIPVIWELGPRPGWLLYLAVSLLSLFMAPDKEAAFLFLFLLGWYPILRPKLQHLTKKPVRILVKLVIFNLATLLMYALLLFVLVMPDLQAEAADWTGLLLAAMLLLGNAAFLLYDLLLARMTDLYVYRLRPKLFPRHF